MRFNAILLFAIMILTTASSLAGQPDLESFLDGGPKKPVQPKALPPGAKVLWSSKAKVWDPVWLDGQRLACLSDEPGQPVWVLHVPDGAQTRFGQPGVKSSLAVFPDGRLAYVAGKGEQRSLHLLSIVDGRETVLGKGWNPAVRRDGNEIACDTAQGPMVCILDQTPPRGIKIPLPDARTVEDGYPRFLSDGAILYAQQGHVYLWDRRSNKPQRIAAQNMQDLTFYQWALPSPDGRHAALFSTNASALSKPPSTWLAPLVGEDRTPREVCLGQPVEWIRSQALLVLRSGNLCRVAAAAGAKAEAIVEGVAGAALSPDGKRLALLCTTQDTNGDGQIDWRDGTSILLKDMPLSER